MTITLPDGLVVHLIGDPHLGRKFEVGVPLHRRGERERKLLQHFINELENEADVIIVIGDLFDHPYVGYNVVDAASRALRSAAERNEDTHYIVMAGNHDVPRLITAVGAFHDLDQRLSDRLPNLQIARKPVARGHIGIFPWEWDRRADEQVGDLCEHEIHIAIGHWDLSLFEGRDDHLAPVEELQRCFGPDVRMYSGHYHVPGDYRVKGATIVGTGSLEPLAHDQDTTGAIYVTEPLGAVLEAPAGYYHDKHLRVILKPGETLPEVDAFAVTALRVADDKVIERTIMSLRDFDWNKILADHISRLDPTVQAFIKERHSIDDQRAGSDKATGHSTQP